MDSNNIIIERQDELKSEVMGAVGAEFAVVDQATYIYQECWFFKLLRFAKNGYYL